MLLLRGASFQHELYPPYRPDAPLDSGRLFLDESWPKFDRKPVGEG